MSVKKQKNIRIDESVLNEFEKIANRKKQKHNSEIEDLMKQYIARDGQLLFDELYAPRIEHTVKQAMDDQVNRLAKMISKVSIDATASIYSTPLLHNQILKGTEDILERYLDVRILNQNRTPISQEYTVSKTANNAIGYMRKLAYTDHDQQRAKQRQEKQVQ